MPRIEIERIEEVDDLDESSGESFDRVAFAETALALVQLVNTRVAICGGARKLRVEAGRQWGKGEGLRWAVLSVPINASRRAIASAVLELSTYGALRPWALDLLVGGTESVYRGRGRKDPE